MTQKDFYSCKKIVNQLFLLKFRYKKIVTYFVYDHKGMDFGTPTSKREEGIYFCYEKDLG